MRKIILSAWQAVKKWFGDLDFSPNYSLKTGYDGRYKLPDRPFKTDADALAADWKKIGGDFQKTLGDWHSKK